MSVGIFAGVRVYTCVYISVCVCTSTCKHSYQAVCMHTDEEVCVRVYIRVDVCVCSNTVKHTGTSVCVLQNVSAHVGTLCVCAVFDPILQRGGY